MKSLQKSIFIFTFVYNIRRYIEYAPIYSRSPRGLHPLKHNIGKNIKKFKKWARPLPNWGTTLTHHGQRACPCWADLLSE